MVIPESQKGNADDNLLERREEKDLWGKSLREMAQKVEEVSQDNRGRPQQARNQSPTENGIIKGGNLLIHQSGSKW